MHKWTRNFENFLGEDPRRRTTLKHHPERTTLTLFVHGGLCSRGACGYCPSGQPSGYSVPGPWDPVSGGPISVQAVLLLDKTTSCTLVFCTDWTPASGKHCLKSLQYLLMTSQQGRIQGLTIGDTLIWRPTWDTTGGPLGGTVWGPTCQERNCFRARGQCKGPTENKCNRKWIIFI